MIYVVSLYYPPESNPPANRMNCLVMSLVERYGVEQVRVVTGLPNYPHGKLSPEYRWRLWKRGKGVWGERIDHIFEIPSAFQGRFLKTLGMLSFGISVFLYFLFKRVKASDLVFVTSGPVFPAYSLYFLKRIKRHLRFVMDVRDLWPQMVAGLGFIDRSSLMYRTMMRLSDATYRAAEAVTGNTDGICDYVREAAPEQAVSLIYNPVDTNLFQPCEAADVAALKEADPEVFAAGKPVFLYYGAFSRYVDLPLLCRAVKRLSERRRDFVFLLIGAGDDKETVEQYVADHNLSDVMQLRPFMPRSELVRYASAADVCYCSAKQDPHNEIMIPTKMCEYMACNRYVLSVLESPFVKQAAADGYALLSTPGDEVELAAKIETLIESRGQYNEGLKSRAFIEANFSVQCFRDRMIAALEPLIGRAAEVKGSEA